MGLFVSPSRKWLVIFKTMEMHVHQVSSGLEVLHKSYKAKQQWDSVTAQFSPDECRIFVVWDSENKLLVNTDS